MELTSFAAASLVMGEMIGGCDELGALGRRKMAVLRIISFVCTEKTRIMKMLPMTFESMVKRCLTALLYHLMY